MVKKGYYSMNDLKDFFRPFKIDDIVECTLVHSDGYFLKTKYKIVGGDYNTDLVLLVLDRIIQPITKNPKVKYENNNGFKIGTLFNFPARHLNRHHFRKL